jgi:hypothetical protein
MYAWPNELVEAERRSVTLFAAEREGPETTADESSLESKVRAIQTEVLRRSDQPKRLVARGRRGLIGEHRDRCRVAVSMQGLRSN